MSNNHASHSQNVWFDSPPEQECRHWVVFIWKNCEECFLTKFPNEIRTLISGRVKAADSKQFQHWRKWRLWWWLSGYVTWSMTEFPIARLPARLLVAGILVIINTDRIRTAVTRPLDFLILIETVLGGGVTWYMCSSGQKYSFYLPRIDLIIGKWIWIKISNPRWNQFSVFPNEEILKYF